MSVIILFIKFKIHAARGKKIQFKLKSKKAYRKTKYQDLNNKKK